MTLHVNDVGIPIEITIEDDGIPVDVSEMISATLILRPPNGTNLLFPLEFVTDGLDGRLSYTLEDGDLATCGTWKVQAKITMEEGAWHSEVEEFEVAGNLAD